MSLEVKFHDKKDELVFTVEVEQSPVVEASAQINPVLFIDGLVRFNSFKLFPQFIYFEDGAAKHIVMLMHSMHKYIYEDLKKFNPREIRQEFGLRIAFDDIKYEKLYRKKIFLAAEYDIKILSNYILFNYKDTPEDFYRRLQINIELNEEFKGRGYQTRIWSFPMKYSPVSGEWCKGRNYIGKNWNKKYLRGIQCILLATHGVVGPKRQFFEKAFGRNFEEFKKLVSLPESYIIYREENKRKRKALGKRIDNLSFKQKKILTDIILKNNFKELKLKSYDRKVFEILKIYKLKE